MINLIKRLLGIHIHDWGKWSRQEVEYFSRFQDECCVYTRLERYCKVCGDLETKRDK